MSEQDKPTRAQLRETKRKLAMVRRGHKLLKRKQESLMIELFRSIEAFKHQSQAAEKAYTEAQRACTLAEMASGRHATWGFAMTRTGRRGVAMEFANYMGVRVPDYRLVSDGAASTFIPGEPPQSFEAAKVCEAFLQECVALAQAEARIAALVDEIERTKRRVNALELKVIPRFEAEAAFILSRLEELERENLFSLKRIRSKLATRGGRG